MRIPFFSQPSPPLQLITVDDDRIWQEFFALVSTANYSVHVTRCLSLDAALKSLSKQSFDALLLDVSLPEGSGLDLYPTILSRWPTLAVTFVSGHVDDKLTAKIRAIGPAPVVSKDQLMDRSFIDLFLPRLGARPKNKAVL